MIYAILADIHANLAAFGAVLEDIEGKGGADAIWCLGDIVGYGPDPVECIELLNQYQHIAVAGNHDWGAIGKMDLKEFNPVAAAACRWTAQQLRSAEIKYLDSCYTQSHTTRESFGSMSAERTAHNCSFNDHPHAPPKRMGSGLFRSQCADIQV